MHGIKIIGVFWKKLTAPWRYFKDKKPLAAFITSRLVTMFTMLFLLGFALFALIELAPGDIVDQLMQQQLIASTGGSSASGTGASEGASGFSKSDSTFGNEQYAKLRKELGLDKPFYMQYFSWLNRVIVHHDLGVSLISRAPVSFLIRTRLINSLILNLISLVTITVFSVPSYC